MLPKIQVNFPKLNSSTRSHILFFNFIFNWRIIALQNFVVFCQTSTWISHEVKSLSRVRLYDPVDCSLPGSSVHGILQARILEWVTISFSRGSSRPRDQTLVSRIGGRCFNLWATYIPSLLNLSPISLPIPLGWYRTPVWVSWAIQQIPVGYLFYI